MAIRSQQEIGGTGERVYTPPDCSPVYERGPKGCGKKMPDMDDWLKRGLAAHQAGRLAEAEGFYERVIEQESGHAEALYLMGTAAGQRGDWGRSAALIRKAIAVRPTEGRYYNNLGIALKRQGLVDEAVETYRAALARQPDSPEALSNLGNLLAIKGHAQEAAAFCRRAVELRPAYAEAHFNLGLALEGLGNGGEARAAYERAVTLQPRMAEGQYRLGIICRGHGDLARALTCFQAALRVRPGMGEALVDAGVVLEKMGRTEEAEDFYRRAIRAQPGNAAAENNLGNLLRARGDWKEAVACYRRAVGAVQAFPEAWYNLGSALAGQGDAARQEAIEALEKALALRPEYVEAMNNLGALLRQVGRFDEALALYDRGLAADANSASLLNNRGEVLFALQRFDEAIAACRQALRAPGGENAEVLNNLAAAHNMTGDLDNAVEASQRATGMDPGHAAAWSNLGSGLRARGDLEPAIAAYRRAMQLKPDPVWHSNLLYALHFHPEADARILLREHQAWDRLHAASLAPADPREHDARGGRRLRIGYVSPDFRNHPVGRFMAGTLEKHDSAAVEVFCYSDVIVADALTERMRAAAQAWRNIQGLSDEAVARMIRRDRIDVLIDLTMHMNRNRLLVFARRPAPVQATYLAYCSTTGLSAMDYRITDAHLDPPGNDVHYTEKSLRLPGSYWCYAAPAEAPDVNALPALQNGYVTFGCLNHFSKVSEPALASWRDLLVAAPKSRLILHAHPGRHRQRVLAFFEEGGVAAGRIEFAALQAMPGYFAMYQCIDVALDPFPYAGGTTTCDALWMGVPVVTLRGRTGVGRGGVSLLMNLGLPELIAGTSQEYVAIASGLARDVERLHGLRASMRERMRGTAVMDARGLAEGLERAYREMWEQRLKVGFTR